MYQEKINKLDKIYNIYSIIRLILFIGIFTCLFFLKHTFIYYIIGALTIIFIVIIVFHSKVSHQLKFYQTLEDLIKEFNDKKELNFKDQKLPGEINNLAKDLDLDKLYSLINYGYTYKGKKLLFDHLSNPSFSDEEIKQRQEAIKEMYNDHNFFKNKFIAFSRMKKQKKINYDFESFDFNRTNKYKLLYLILSIIGLTVFVLVCCQLLPWYVLLIMTLINYYANTLDKNNLKEYKNALDSLSLTFETYNDISKVISEEKFHSKYLIEIKNDLLSGQESFKKLMFINSLGAFLKNPLTEFIFNGLFSLEGNVYTLFLWWGQKYKDNLFKSIDAIAKEEEIISFTTINEISDCCEVKFSDELEVSFKDARHPLIKNCIDNNVDFKHSSTIVTGSNMSGKTTYLRSIGINIVLGLNGSYVIAKEATLSNLKLFTSMRVNDDVNNGISTFYAEIKRIKEMIDYSKEDKKMVCLIDEIFKGTNSIDRIKGATEGIKKLTTDHSIIIVSTHDFELCGINGINNFHFQEYYEDDKIHFSYKLMDGKCKTSNAQFLMKLAGIIE